MERDIQLDRPIPRTAKITAEAISHIVTSEGVVALVSLCLQYGTARAVVNGDAVHDAYLAHNNVMNEYLIKL